MNKLVFVLSIVLYQLVFPVHSEDTVIIGPRCIPLTSKNIRANPYHSSLLSIPGKQIRVGLGVPSHLPINPIKCNRDSPQGCTIRLSESLSTTISNSYSISLGKSQGFSAQIGKGTTNGKSNMMTKSIGNSIEKSINQQSTVTDEASVAKSISESLSNTHEKSTGIAKTKSKDESNSNTISQDVSKSGTVSTEVSLTDTTSRETSKSSTQGGSSSNSESQTHEHTVGASVSATANFIFGSVSVSANYQYTNTKTNTKTSEENWSRTVSESSGYSKSKTINEGTSKTDTTSNGSSNTKLTSQGSSSTADSRASDAVMTTKENAETSTKSKSNSETDGKTETNSYRIDDSYQASVETSIMQNSALSNETSKNENTVNETSVQRTHTTSYDRTYTIDPGDCKIVVCKAKVKAIAIPYECISETNDTVIELFADYFFDMQRDEKGDVKCYEGLIDCFDENKENYFKIENDEFSKANLKNSLSTGEHLTIDKKYGLNAMNEEYTLELKPNGELVLNRGNIIIWTNGMNLFDETKHKIRMRINEKGHFIEEVQGIFSNFSTDYRKDEWILVWSTAPIHHDVTIGIPRDPETSASYKLILESNGKLNLYDAVGALIWCATDIGHRKCNHRFGYKFPENYLVPMDISTPPDTDKHNSIDPRVKFNETHNYINSIDVDCNAGLMANQGIMSKNKRFKLILEESGNMIIKDGYRTMWDSASGYLHFAEPPFKLVVFPTGNVAILDSNNLLIWNSLVQTKNSILPYKLELLDSGRLVVTDSKKQEIWESMPLRGMSFGRTIYSKIVYKYIKCRWYYPKRGQNITAMKSNLRNTINVNEWLFSENKNHSLRITNKALYLDKQPLFEVETGDNLFKLRTLEIDDEGDLVLSNMNNDTVWRSNSRAELGVYRVVVDNYGKLVIFNNKNGNISWSYTPCLEDVYTAQSSDSCEAISNRFNIQLQTLQSQNLWIDCQRPLEGKVFCVPGTNALKVTNNTKLKTFYRKEVTVSNVQCWSKCKEDRECAASSFGRENNTCLLSKEKYKYTREQGWLTYSLKELSIDALSCEPLSSYKISENDTCVSLVDKFNISIYEFHKIYAEMNCDKLAKDQVVCLPNTKSIPENNIRLYEHMKEIKSKKSNECWQECLKNIRCVASSTYGSSCFLYDANYRFGYKEYGWYTRSLTEFCPKGSKSCKI